ncbi:FtsW/RodA/SpoVE family cell cycle protein [Alkalihalobacillus oceani]|uniref:FtsW/RodA/SpoVE family cell cycle protein n=1 Tax=Halalkalibacter oceani TaxID=1653776 RepID=A0A9X2DUS2_9BACI|nr:FtsW/RodA/SpoVE family cell cycle protein [Halalkalibacter oceani]MCM3716460.1 FtsW/RodA/SpoVE family cell cycle protein [Halalkalibacter oceani]
MSSSNFEEFLTKVTSKVKAKEARSMIKKELIHHLQELSHSFQQKTASKEEADERAIQEMGNPFTLGENLNRLHRPKIDWLLIALFVIIAGNSFLPLIHGNLAMSLPSTFYFSRQAIWLTLAVVAIVAFLFFDYRKLKNYWWLFYGSGLILLLYTYLFGLMKLNAVRWISIAGMSVDSSAIALFLFFLAWAGIFHNINTFNSWKKQALLVMLFWAPILLYMMLPHIVLSIIYCFCILAMFACSHVQKKLALTLVATNLLMGILLLSTTPLASNSEYHLKRLSDFMNPETDPNGVGYIYILVGDILSQAGWLGNGFSNHFISRLPAAHTDYVFPFLVYSFGWAFGIALCLILLLFIVRISRNAFKTKDRYGRLLVIGGAALIAVPTCWNILMGIGFVPIMEVSLPFISYGGSMLLVNSGILGLILSVYRRKDLVNPTIIHS